MNTIKELNSTPLQDVHSWQCGRWHRRSLLTDEFPFQGNVDVDISTLDRTLWHIQHTDVYLDTGEIQSD